MPRHGVQYVGTEPSFITKMKEKAGFKEGPDVNTKRQMPNLSDDEDEDAPVKEDEKPVVVVLKSGDLTAEEAESEQKSIDDGPARLDEKITFKKPVKRKPDQLDEGEKEKKETEDVSKKSKKDSKSKSKDAKSQKSKQKSSLLSFGDEEEEDET